MQQQESRGSVKKDQNMKITATKYIFEGFNLNSHIFFKS